MSILDPDNTRNVEREEAVKAWQDARTDAGPVPSVSINGEDLVSVIDRQTGARKPVTIEALAALLNA